MVDVSNASTPRSKANYKNDQCTDEDLLDEDFVDNGPIEMVQDIDMDLDLEQLIKDKDEVLNTLERDKEIYEQ